MFVKKFASQSERYLQELHEELRQGNYKPLAVKRVFIPKNGGGERPLGIPAVKDRIVQAALKMVIEPIDAAILIMTLCLKSINYVKAFV